MTIDIGGQQIDKITGDWLHINNELTRNIEKKRGYDIMIGNIKKLTTFNNKKKDKHVLYIPIPFWFCKFIEMSLQMVALQYVEIKITVNLKKLQDVAYWEQGTVFVNNPKLRCHMVGEYIYIDIDERKLICDSKQENLIEVLQMYTNIYVNKENIINETINIPLKFKNPCKELIWIVRNNMYINGDLPNNKKQYNIFTYNNINPINTVTITFYGNTRESSKQAEYYNYIPAYECHTNIPINGINVYSFSLYPELLNPSGSANFSKIDDSYLILNLKDNIYNNIIETNGSLSISVYSVSYNILRIMSGLSGAAWGV